MKTLKFTPADLQFCDPCLEQGEADEIPQHLMESILHNIGWDIGDHYCHMWETEGEIHCDCSCSPWKGGIFEGKRNPR